MHGDYQVFLGLDVGKDGHHAVALNRDGKRLHDATLVNTEAKLRQVFDKLARHGQVLVVVDQPASIGALPVAVARACGHQVARCGGPAGLRKAGRRKLTSIANKNAPRMGERLVEGVMAALDEQTVIVPGTAAAETILPRLADSLRDMLQQRDQVADEVDRMLDTHPLAEVLTSMPGIGVRTAARILLEVGDGSSFASPGHLAAYAGLAPVTRRSSSSIRGEHPARGGNKQLKRAFFLAAFAALADPVNRAYYDRKRAQGKKHNAALICLARRRCDVLFATLRDKIPYQPRPLPALASAA